LPKRSQPAASNAPAGTFTMIFGITISPIACTDHCDFPPRGLLSKMTFIGHFLT
jgi:hypothetical protein